MFGDKLYEALKMRHMQQKDLAKAVGTSDVSISRYISNERNPKITTAIKIANVLNVSLDWLCENKQIAKADGIKLYQQGWNDAIDAMQNAKFVSVADRKDEPQYSEDDMYWLSLAEDVANGKMSDAGANQAWLEYINHKDEPTISKMEQVDKDINVRSKDEPQRACSNCKNKGFEGCEQPCLECGWCDAYEPKDEPQTDRSMAIGKRSDATADKYNLYGKTTTDESQYDFGEYADRLWKIAYERGKREALEQTEPQTEKFPLHVVFEMAVDECKRKHKGCENCDMDCMWRDEQSGKE